MTNNEIKTQFRNQKSALTRAMHIVDVGKRRDAVRAACRAAVAQWEAWPYWPDDWSRWQRALTDTEFAARRAGLPKKDVSDLGNL